VLESLLPLGTRDEVRHAALRLLPDLRTCCFVVGARIVGVRVLIGSKAVRRLFREAFSGGVVGVGVVGCDGGRTDHDFGTVGAKDVDLLGRHLVAHDEDALVAAVRGHDGEPHPGVAARGFDDRGTRTEETLLLSREDHGQRGSVLGTATRIRRLQLRDEVTLEISSDGAQADHWRVANEFQRALGHVHIGVTHNSSFLLGLHRFRVRTRTSRPHSKGSRAPHLNVGFSDWPLVRLGRDLPVDTFRRATNDFGTRTTAGPVGGARDGQVHEVRRAVSVLSLVDVRLSRFDKSVTTMKQLGLSLQWASARAVRHY